MKTKSILALIIAICAAHSAFSADQTDEKSPPKTFFPLGHYSAALYGGMMTSAGKGVVEFKQDEEGGIALTVTNSEGTQYNAHFSKDRSKCLFLKSVKLDSEGEFARSSGGALGDRMDRSWSSDRYTVLIGYTFSDRMHVVYLRDRATNNPLLIAKFPPPDDKR